MLFPEGKAAVCNEPQTKTSAAQRTRRGNSTEKETKKERY